MRPLLLFLPLLTLCSNQIAIGQSIRIDSLVTSLYEDHNINGNVLVTGQEGTLYEKSFGYARFETKTPNHHQ